MQNAYRRNRAVVVAGVMLLAVMALLFVAPFFGAAPATAKPVEQNRFAYRVQVRPNSTEPALWVMQSNANGAAFQIDKRQTSTPGVYGTPTPIFKISKAGAISVWPTESLTGAMIANVSRALNLPLETWYDCDTNAGDRLAFAEGTPDAVPDYSNSSTDGLGRVILFDDTSGTPDVSSSICSDFIVPPDYASGGAFLIRALKDTHTGVAEWLNTQVSINGAALGTNAGTTTTGTATTAYTLTPAGTYTAGASVSAAIQITSTGTITDTVSIAGVEWTYTSTQ